MSDLSITSKGYRVLEETGFSKRIDDSWDEIKEIIPAPEFIYVDELKRRIHKIKYFERKKAMKDLIRTSEEDARITPDDLFRVSGKITDFILTEGEIKNYLQSDISLSEIDSLLATYVLEKYADTRRNSYVWVSDKSKISVYGEGDKDLHINQQMLQNEKKKKSSGKERLVDELPQNHMWLDYKEWSVLAAIALKYVDTLDENIPAISAWQNLMRKYGWNGEISKPTSYAIGYTTFSEDYLNKDLVQLTSKDKIIAKQNTKLPFGMMQSKVIYGVYYIPVIMAENKDIVIYENRCNKTNCEDPHIKITINDVPQSSCPVLYIPKENIQHLFESAVHGIMTDQSRNTPAILAHMFSEWEQIIKRNE